MFVQDVRGAVHAQAVVRVLTYRFPFDLVPKLIELRGERLGNNVKHDAS